MKKFLKNRALPFVCTLSILISLCVVPVSAVWDHVYDVRDMDSVDVWNSRVGYPANFLIYAEKFSVGAQASLLDVFWNYVDTAIGLNTGSVSLTQLNNICQQYQGFFDRDNAHSFFGQLKQGTAEFLADCFGLAFLGVVPKFEVKLHESSGYHRIWCSNRNAWVVNSVGEYAYADAGAIGEEGSDQWIGEVTAADRAEKEVAVHSLDRLNMICLQLREYGIPAQIKDLGTNYKCIWYNRQVYANSDGIPYVAAANDDKWAVNQDRPQTSVTDGVNEIVEGILEGITPGIDLSNMTVTLPDGRVNFIDNLIYDESTKTYTVDSHDTYTTENNYYLEWNYEWNYYINFTSITYIGQTEEYNKYYEVYYELPDGRDSADLSKEDLEQLNLSIDVIPYGRSADDTSLRSLYHFDGDTKDSSYWNYCTDFTWNKGASLTYMEAGAFEGALYLDETEHDFTIQLPSSIGTGDFTIQFRYYQSYTAAPQTDSYVSIGSQKILQFNGSSIFTHAASITAVPIGSWNEIAVVRKDGYVYWYLNGVHSANGPGLGSTYFTDTITFHFGSSQQTYKYFDELRILNEGLYAGENYTPTSVPHDTNLTLVLPDSAVPIADEYWSITSSGDNLFQYDMDDGKSKGFAGIYTTQTIGSTYGGSSSSFTMYALDEGSTAFAFPTWGINQTYLSSSVGSDCVVFTSSRNSLVEYNTVHSANGSFISQVGYWVGTALSTLISYNSAGYLANGAYVLSVVLEDGTISSYPFTMSNGRPTSSNVLTFDWGTIGIAYCASRYGSGADQTPSYYLYIQPNVNEPVSIRHIELIQGTETDLKAEFVSSIVGIDRDSLNTPTLAVRTDIDITSYQIGGPRPSLPEKGMVWALVENERITSLQVYNGQAWEAVDGRIWTGERWVPYNAYNIITLQDMYDIVDATPDFEYIYSESGFWTWWQKSWNAFTEKLFKALGSGGSGGSIDEDSLPSVPDDEATGEDDGWSFIDLLVVIKDGTWNIVTGIVSTTVKGIEGLSSAVSNISDFFDVYQSDHEDYVFSMFTYEGDDIWA